MMMIVGWPVGENTATSVVERPSGINLEAQVSGLTVPVAGERPVASA
jgi:hypothetical protein